MLNIIAKPAHTIYFQKMKKKNHQKKQTNEKGEKYWFYVLVSFSQNIFWILTALLAQKLTKLKVPRTKVDVPITKDEDIEILINIYHECIG